MGRVPWYVGLPDLVKGLAPLVVMVVLGRVSLTLAAATVLIGMLIAFVITPFWIKRSLARRRRKLAAIRADTAAINADTARIEAECEAIERQVAAMEGAKTDG